MKINFDGAIFGASNISGISVVMRDSNGDVLTSCSKKIPQAYKAEENEALAAFKALSLRLCWDLVVLSLKVILLA